MVALIEATLLFNPRGGHAREGDLDEVVSRLAATFALDVRTLEEGSNPTEFAREAVARGARVVIAAGGDGTVSGVSDALVGTGVALGILPRGTANSLSVCLGIPQDLAGACDVLTAGATRTIDCARVGERMMVLLATAGFAADAIGNADPDTKSRFGKLAYLLSGIEQMGTHEPFSLELAVDGHLLHCTASAVTVANVAPPTTVLAQGPSVISMDDGLLDVTIVAARDVPEAVTTAMHLWRTAAAGLPADRDNVGYLRCTEVTVTATPPQKLVVDGELVGETPFTVRVLPRALTVLAPPAEPVKVLPEARLTNLPDFSSTPR